SSEVDIVAINDSFIDPNYMVYMFQYDSTHTNFTAQSRMRTGNFSSVESPFPSSRSEPTNIKCGDAGTEYVMESTGFTTMEKAETHLKGRPFADASMFVMGVNHEKHDTLKIVSNASCSTNCLVPLAKVIHDNFVTMEGLMIIVYAITTTQKTVDGPSEKLWGDGPGAASIASLLQLVIPELNGKPTGMAFHVPTPMTVIDLTSSPEKAAKYDDIKKVVKQTSEGPHKDIWATLTARLFVSCNFNSDSYSSTFDAGAAMALNDQFVKLISRYDNKFGHSDWVVDFMVHMASKE
uniref:Glyceraldehyde-3-phosphate dehydrogenase n=1 Tax=Mustela putorius furo TaxID=9669 RepID=M3YXH2_MUSPF